MILLQSVGSAVMRVSPEAFFLCLLGVINISQSSPPSANRNVRHLPRSFARAINFCCGAQVSGCNKKGALNMHDMQFFSFFSREMGEREREMLQREALAA